MNVTYPALQTASIIGLLSPAQPDEHALIQTAYIDARDALDDKRFSDAADMYAALWLRTREQWQWFSLRNSFWASDVQRLVASDARARDKFMDLRNALTAAVEEEKASAFQLVDWLILNRIVAEPARTLAWFDNHKVQFAKSGVSPELRPELEPLLEVKGRWADLAILYADPIGNLRDSWRSIGVYRRFATEGPDREAEAQEMMCIFYAQAGRRYAAFSASKQPDLARKIRDTALALSDNSECRLSLVEWAAKAGVAGKEDRAMLEEARRLEHSEDVDRRISEVERAMADAPAAPPP